MATVISAEACGLDHQFCWRR